MAPDDPRDGRLSAPAVSADEYDRDYYLHAAMGADQWRESDGREVAGIYQGSLSLAGFASGESVLDIGCGRGELVRVALELGASRAAGIDYSEAAIEMGRETLAASELGGRGELAQGDARALPHPDAGFDLVTMLDVVEHMTPEELSAGLREALRVLKPGGRIFVHTAPNRLIYDVTYRLQRAALPWRLRTWPADPRNDYERSMHVNEQTTGSLSAALREAGFGDVSAWNGEWVYRGHLPGGSAGRAGRWFRFAARTPLRRFVAMDIFARGIRGS